MSAYKFQISPVRTADLCEFYTVMFQSLAKTDWFTEVRFSPWLQQPSYCRPPAGHPAPYPALEAVTKDRAARRAAVIAESFDGDRHVDDIRFVKACLVGAENDGKIVGIARWSPTAIWGREEDGTPGKPKSEAQRRLELIQAEGYDDEWLSKTNELRAKVLPEQGSAWELDNLYVLPAYQGQGLGTALIGEGLDFIKQTEIKPCFLESAPGAVDFYKRHGFISVGEFSVKGWKGGAPREGEEMDTFVLNCLVTW